MNSTDPLALFQELVDMHKRQGEIYNIIADELGAKPPAPAPMPAPEPEKLNWFCYLRRYKDVRNIAKARNMNDAEAKAWAETHFNRWGRAEGRVWGCVEAPEPVGGVGPKKLVGAGFIFKPVSESRGNVLVILLPASFPDHNVVLVDGEGHKDGGHRTNGNKPTYWFSKPGGHYPNPVEVVINGERYCVKNPDQRHDDGYLWECAG